MTTRVVREDEKGIYVITNGAKYRPGDVVGYAHCNDMSAGTLVKGNKVTVRMIPQSPLCEIHCYPTNLVWAIKE